MKNSIGRTRPRTLRAAQLAALTGAAAIAAAAGTAAPAPKTVVGSVGPGFTIDLKLGGKKVTQLKAGVPYRFLVHDRAAIHDFHLSGPGVQKVVTSVEFTGTKRVTVTLKKGTYRYVCDPHSGEMKGSFTVR